MPATLIDMTPGPNNLAVVQGNDVTFLIGLKSDDLLIDLSNYSFRVTVRHPRSKAVVASVFSGSGIEIEPGSSNEYVRVLIDTTDTDSWTCYDKPYLWAAKTITPAPENYEIDILRGLITVEEKITDD